jgi:hypothetical protein
MTKPHYQMKVTKGKLHINAALALAARIFSNPALKCSCLSDALIARFIQDIALYNDFNLLGPLPSKDCI